MKKQKPLLAALMVALLLSCVATNDYERGGDLSERIKEDKAWYCGEGMLGIRAVGRFVARWVFQIPVPDVCKVIDTIIEVEADET